MSFTFQDIGEAAAGCNCTCSSGSTCQITATVKSCTGTLLVGATVTVTQGATTTGTCSTDSSGVCSVTVPATGTYNVAATMSGYGPFNQNVTVSSCPGTTTVTLALQAVADQSSITVRGCGSVVLPTATLTVGGGTYTANSSGVIYFTMPVGSGQSFSVSDTTGRFISQTGTTSLSSCTGTASINGNTYTLSAASGYVCNVITSCNPYPVSTTLYISTPPVTLVAIYNQYGSSSWEVCGTFNTSYLCTGGPPPTSCNTTYAAGVAACILNYLTATTLDIDVWAYNFSTYRCYSASGWTTCPGTPVYACNGHTELTIPVSMTLDSCMPFSASGSLSVEAFPFTEWNGSYTVTE